MKKSFAHHVLKLALIPALIALTSCTTVIKPKPRSTTYSAGDKIPLRVALNLTDELRNAKWEQRALTGGGTKMAVGPALAEDAPECARNTFTDVVEIKNGGTPPTPVDAILTPKMAFIGIKFGQTMFSKDAITIKLEWTLTDPSGSILWADTVTGVGESKGGFTKDLTLAVEDVFRKSQQTMLASPVTRQLAVKKSAGAGK